MWVVFSLLETICLMKMNSEHSEITKFYGICHSNNDYDDSGRKREKLYTRYFEGLENL